MLRLIGFAVVAIVVSFMWYPWPVRFRFHYDLSQGGRVDLASPHLKFLRWSRLLPLPTSSDIEKAPAPGSAPTRFLSTIVRIDTLRWETNVGTGDASLTGLLYGVIWAVKGVALNALARSYDVRGQRAVVVHARWDTAGFATSLNCIIRVRPGHVIGVHVRYWWATTVKGVGRLGAGERSSH